jgi:hypothetical protein
MRKSRIAPSMDARESRSSLETNRKGPPISKWKMARKASIRIDTSPAKCPMAGATRPRLFPRLRQHVFCRQQRDPHRAGRPGRRRRGRGILGAFQQGGPHKRPCRASAFPVQEDQLGRSLELALGRPKLPVLRRCSKWNFGSKWNFAATGVGDAPGLSPGSADREHQIAPHPRRPPSSLRPGLSFRYTQGMS